MRHCRVKSAVEVFSRVFASSNSARQLQKNTFIETENTLRDCARLQRDNSLKSTRTCIDEISQSYIVGLAKTGSKN